MLFWLFNQPFSLTQVTGLVLVSWTALVLPEVLPVQRERWALFLIPLVGSAFFASIDGLTGLGSYLAFTCFAALCLVMVEILLCNLPGQLAWTVVASGGVFFSGAMLGTLQIIEQFSEEEFFVAVQFLLLGGWWWLLYAVWHVVFHPRKRLQAFSSPVLRAGLAVFLMACIVLGGAGIVNRYQASFLPQNPAAYPGISVENPFVCGEVDREVESTYDARRVYQGLVERAESNPNKNASLLGMLALAAPEAGWEEDFHQELLKEVRQGAYTGPAGSVKYGQYEVSQRVYYFYELNQRDPGLFSQAEKKEILDWLAAVNQRALTVEWVDWMYSTAFGEWPKGPYLNQEIGAGLLSLLEVYGYAGPGLSGQNQAFLSAHNLSWNQGFRNTDDSISYQALWINNAVFQSLYTGIAPLDRVEHSFEWLLLQARPDGSLVGYNPSQVSLALSAYLGARMTGDGRYIWLAGRVLDYLKAHDLPLYAQLGLEEEVNLPAEQPGVGSCLIFAGSGTPVRQSPLAPDKIVFRDGWQPGDRYLSLNLRFIGWHRYKATNSIISIYEEEPLIIERTESAPTSWLPVGRSQFRDKRIPRENLNGLVISRQGLSRLIFWMTGYGSPWAQDPPYYAEVESFQTGAEMDSSVTRMEWNGWTQVRSIYFVHDGPTVVVDDVIGPKNQSGGVVWHGVLPEDSQAALEQAAENRFRIGTSGNAEIVVLSFGEDRVSHKIDADGSQPGIDIDCTDTRGEIKLATLFLSGRWLGASIAKSEGVLLIQIPGETVTVPLSPDF